MKTKVLVVDDNMNNMTLEKDLLELAGFEVFEAGNCTDGIATARLEVPDVIVMDVRLPDMRGSDAAKILRGDDKTCGIPIVFVTASVLPMGRAELQNIPNSGFIGKPINTRTFAREIMEFVRKP
jgi:two-component system, cell cycle response regulator DivK